ncbi:MAG: uracil-DNA glycosylase [Prolixibacteraceae bacterium]|nr:uracil-DNA glycosylase [Prolixibacteraceae bacterium]
MAITKEKIQKLEILNYEIKKCERCGLCFKKTNVIIGEGNVDARFFFIAQAPGKTEDKEGRMFIGPTGKVIDELFEKINLKRDEVYMTNLIKCRLPKNRKPSQNEIETCSKYMEQEIEIIKPEFLIPLGYHSTKYIFNRYCNKNFLSTDFVGKLIYCNDQKIYPLRHPSAALYNPSLMESMSGDFQKISVFKEDCKWFPVCPMKKLFENGKLDRRWIETYCKGDWISCVRYSMEENGQYHPDNMLPDGTISRFL